MVILDLFSGIGGFSKGLIDAGFQFETHYFSEIDKHAIANYSYNFKNSHYVGSVTNVRGTELKRPNIITFGSPCQDFSMAGKRLGMEGERSSLILEAIRLISECRPDVFIWENVKGTFSSNDGADFIAILQAFANIGGYRIEWQLLNTAWVLPQNRERLYLVGHLAGRSKLGVFPIGTENRKYQELEIERKPTFSCLTRRGAGEYHSGMQLIRIKNKLRVPTEIECEKAQGFPENWTKYGINSAGIYEIPRVERYKMLGNSVTTKIVELVGNGIRNCLET